jgi:hypothetical protein
MAGFGAFAVPSGADEEFLGAWRRERSAGATLYRALRSDVPFRFVELTSAGPYEVLHEDGEPQGEGGVVLITRFARDDRIPAAWQRLRSAFAPLRGYLGARLLAGDDVVAVIRWSSPLMYARAGREPDVRRALAALPSPGEGALYLAQ